MPWRGWTSLWETALGPARNSPPQRLCTKSRRTGALACFARVSPSARGRMTQQNERLYSPPRRGGEPPGAQRGGRGSVRRLFVQSPPQLRRGGAKRRRGAGQMIGFIPIRGYTCLRLQIAFG